MSHGKAIYPGSFDPVTYGHLDIIRRASRLFGRLVVGISQISSKNATFTPEERLELLKEALREANIRNVGVEIFDGLLVDYLVKSKAETVVRGLRFISDFEYEFQMALMNRRLRHTMETVFLMPDEKYIYLSSSIIKEISRGGRKLKDFVPRCVESALKKRLSH